MWVFSDFDLIKQFVFDDWVDSCLTSLVTILHCLYFSLSGIECEGCSVFARFTSEDLIGPLLIFKLKFLWFAHHYEFLILFAQFGILLSSGFITSI